MKRERLTADDHKNIDAHIEMIEVHMAAIEEIIGAKGSEKIHTYLWGSGRINRQLLAFHDELRRQYRETFPQSGRRLEITTATELFEMPDLVEQAKMHVALREILGRQ